MSDPFKLFFQEKENFSCKTTREKIGAGPTKILPNFNSCFRHKKSMLAALNWALFIELMLTRAVFGEKSNFCFLSAFNKVHFLRVHRKSHTRLKMNSCTFELHTLLMSQNFQRRISSSWWNWILLVEWGRYVWTRGLLSSCAKPLRIKLKS